MAEIHCITPYIDADRARNLSVLLKALITQSIDPGPRETQIRILGRMLAASVRGLRQELARLGICEALVGLDLDRLESAAHLASEYDPDGCLLTA